MNDAAGLWFLTFLQNKYVSVIYILKDVFEALLKVIYYYQYVLICFDKSVGTCRVSNYHLKLSGDRPALKFSILKVINHRQSSIRHQRQGNPTRLLRSNLIIASTKRHTIKLHAQIFTILASCFQARSTISLVNSRSLTGKRKKREDKI